MPRPYYYLNIFGEVIHGEVKLNSVGIIVDQAWREISPLGAIIGSSKSAVTKLVHELELIDHEKVWKRNYYEHIIRNEEDFKQIIVYIQTNPINWEADIHYEPDQSCV